MKRLFASFLLFWRGPRITAEQCDDVPDELDKGVIYLVGDRPTPWSAALLCPCGCGALIQLSLLPNDRPCWRAQRHFDGTISLYPSVWRNKGCYSHFIVRNGRVLWAKPGAPPASWQSDLTV